MSMMQVTNQACLLHPLQAYCDGPSTPEPQIVQGEPWCEVVCILASRKRKSGRKVIRKYLLQWNGFDDSRNSWELMGTESNLVSG